MSAAGPRRIVAAMACVFVLAGCASSGADTTTQAPPDPAGFLPGPGYYVASSEAVHLGGGPRAEEVITFAARAAPASAVLEVVAWVSNRWTVVYNTADTGLLADQTVTAAELTATPITAAHRTDLAIRAVAAGNLTAAILRYNGGTHATIVWSGRAGGGTATVTGSPARQTLTINAPWISPVDPNCCSVRPYTQTIAATRDGSWRAVADNRPWAGALILQTALEPNEAVVAGTTAGSPLAGHLRPGDIVDAVNGQPLPPNDLAGTILGPPVVDQVALHHPGDRITLDVLRDGQRVEIPVTLSSYANPRRPLSAPAGGWLGLTLTDTAHGPTVALVAPHSPAAAAQVPVGSIITSVAGQPTQRAVVAAAVTAGLNPGQTVPVTFTTTDGHAQTVQVGVVAPPASAGQIIDLL